MSVQLLWRIVNDFFNWKRRQVDDEIINTVMKQ